MTFAQKKFSAGFWYVLDNMLTKNRSAAFGGKRKTASEVPNYVDLVAARGIKIYPAGQRQRAAADVYAKIFGR
jgi:hypothetical protein